jgi:hypothetical protein
MNIRENERNPNEAETHAYLPKGTGRKRRALGLFQASAYSAALITASLLMFCPTPAHAQGGVPLWTNRYDGAAPGFGGARALALDSGGNVFVTGSSTGSGGNSDYATIKYSKAGVPLWTNRYDGPANTNDGASAIAVDSGGNVFVTGGSGSTNGYRGYATIKYSPSVPPFHLAIVPDGSSGYFIRNTSAPNVTYRLQRAPSVSGIWSDLATNTAPASGLIEYHETSPPPGPGFYRAVQP